MFLMKNSCPAAQSELDLLTNAPTATDVEAGYHIQHQPTSNISEGPIRFHIHNDQSDYTNLLRSFLLLTARVENQNEGLATYFRTVARNYLMNWANENGYDLFDDGLKIYTTIDSRMQQYAEEAVSESMDTLQQIFNEHWEGENP